MVVALELKPGMFLRIEREIYKVLEAESEAGSAKLGGVVRTKLCNVTSGRMWEPHFRLQERLEDLEVERRTIGISVWPGPQCRIPGHSRGLSGQHSATDALTTG